MNCRDHFPKSAFTASRLADKHCTKILQFRKTSDSYMSKVRSWILGGRNIGVSEELLVTNAYCVLTPGNRREELKEKRHRVESLLLQLLWSQMLTYWVFKHPPPQLFALTCCSLFPEKHFFFCFKLDGTIENKM